MRRFCVMVSRAAAFATAGCEPALRMTLPESFVEVDEGTAGPYDMRAVSADGVVLATRRQENPENGTLAFWSEAVEKELVSGRGYKLAGAEDVETAGGMAGRMMTFSASRGGAASTYLVAVYVRGSDILLAEAGGKADAVGRHADAVRKAMLSVR